MSSSLIDRSSDLQRLITGGYELEERAGYLLVHSVPYVTAQKAVRRGTLIAPFAHDSERALKPQEHWVYFAGEHPSHADGSPMGELVIASPHQRLLDDVVADHQFSRRPKDENNAYREYRDYEEKLTTYVNLLTNEARVIEPDASARTFRVVVPPLDDSPLQYLDTASSRAGVTIAAAKLKGRRVAVVGGGGTGGYVVDFLAKTHVAEIHVFDADCMAAHNALRGPGAMSREQLRARPNKAAHLRAQYLAVHRGVIAHEYVIDVGNVTELRGMSFVFLCMDPVPAKKVIIDRLHEWAIPFVDVGMGLYEADGSIGGIVRATTSVPGSQEHVAKHVSLVETEGANEYTSNIQIAELNALNAALAVIKWKKLCGFYLDFGREQHSTYNVSFNTLKNSERRPWHA